MNHPVGNRYFDNAMPLGPNSRSDGSMLGSEAVCVTISPFPRGPAAGVHLVGPQQTYAYFYYFRNSTSTHGGSHPRRHSGSVPGTGSDKVRPAVDIHRRTRDVPIAP